MVVLIDAGALVAVANKRDHWHARMLGFFEQAREPLLVPTTVLPEACYLINRALGPAAEVSVLDGILRGTILPVGPLAQDYVRMRELVVRYSNINLGFADASLVAIAERLGITKIVTVDRRDFSLVKPSHCERFELLP